MIDCVVTYSVAAPTFQRTIPRALRAVTSATGVQFREVAADADIAYEQIAVVPGDATAILGMFDATSDTVYLGTVPGMNRLSLTLHETLHALGVEHVAEDGYLMSALFSGVTTITDHDIEGVRCPA